jgi:hypothetical protein
MTYRSSTTFGRLLGVGLVALLIGQAALAQDSRRNIRERIGYRDAAERLGRAMPTAAGIAFAHVEGNAGAYAPVLEGPAYDRVAFSLRSGPSEPSGHATATARIIYGTRGLAPGVEVVHCLTTQDFLEAACLNANTTGPPVAEDPTPFPPRVYNHSWIGNPPEQQAAYILRRADYQIDTRDVVMCVGVNNGRESEVPAILASGYNVIAVGTTNGDSSGGPTGIEVPGRSKPDLVAPNGMTSFTTPVVAACAGLLLEQADRLVEAGHAGANRSEVIKAALLGGAVKNDSWEVPDGLVLDPHLGAGEVNVDRSLKILADEPLQPGQTVKRLFGWAYPTLKPGASAAYELKLPADAGVTTLTAVWNRRIDGRMARLTRNDTGEQVDLWLDAPRLADIDLKLWQVEGEDTTEVAASTSRVDNVELIHLPELAKGHYRIELLRDPDHDILQEDWEVALVWSIDKPVEEEAPDTPEAPEPEV